MIVKTIIKFREEWAINYSLKKIKNKDFTIISDNCWGGSLYTQLKLNYKTPTVGLGMGKHGYLNFIEKLKSEDATTFTELDSSHCYDLTPRRIYPVSKTSLGTVHFLHYKNHDAAVRVFQMRYRKINWENIFYKIDFEHDYYTTEHIQRWNSMQLPNSIAFYSKRVKEIWGEKIHNGVYINNWQKDTSYVFGDFQDNFNYIKWLNTGEITNSLHYKFVSNLLLNPTKPRKIVALLKRMFFKPVIIKPQTKKTVISI